MKIELKYDILKSNSLQNHVGLKYNQKSTYLPTFNVIIHKYIFFFRMRYIGSSFVWNW